MPQGKIFFYAQNYPIMPSVLASQPQAWTQLSLPRSVLWIEASTSAAKARGIKVQLSGHCKAIVMLKPGAYFYCKYSHMERSSQADPIITSGPLIINATATNWIGISLGHPRSNMILWKSFAALQTVSRVEMDPSNWRKGTCSVIMNVPNGQLEVMKKDRIILGSQCGNRVYL